MRIAVIGGGAAGFMGAITAAEENNEARVWLFEKSDKLLSKVRISGGGRCNVTHSCFEPKELATYYPRGNKELLGLFHRFQPADTIEWFFNRGVELKTESDGRMFPCTDNSLTIVNCLMEAAVSAGVNIKIQSAVISIVPKENGFELTVNAESMLFDKVLICNGGSPKYESYAWLETLGHSIQKPVPSLFTFNIPDKSLHELSGLSMPQAIVTIPGTKFQTEGPVLITHWGLSGPGVLKMSAWAARYFADQHYSFDTEVNWIAEWDTEGVADYLRDMKINEGRKTVCTNSCFHIPSRLWTFLCTRALVNAEKKWAEMSEKLIHALAKELTACRFTVNGKTTFKEEFVTCGGITLSEVNFKTMESKVCPGLHFAGEVLDIDGVTGGFNFQAAWSTAFAAGKSMVSEL